VNRNLLKFMLPVALAVLAAVPAPAQISAHLGFGPLEVHMTSDRPPPMRREHRMRSPGAGYLWIGGDWYRDGDRWAWRDGRWDMPPQRGARWIGAVNRREGGYYRHEPAHWSHERVNEGEGYRNWRHEHDNRNGHKHD